MWNLKNDTNESIYKIEIGSETQKTYSYQRREGRWGKDRSGVYGIIRYTILYMKQISDKDLLYSIGNYAQFLAITYNEI